MTSGASKFEEFLLELNPLPQEIRRGLQLMRQLDLKKEGKQNKILSKLNEALGNLNTKLMKQYFAAAEKN